MESLGPPPAGGDQDRGPALRSATIVTTLFIVITLFLRLLTRRFLVHQLGRDDLFIALATAVSVVSTGLNIRQVAVGGGRHEYYLTPPQIIESLKWVDFSEFLLFWSAAFTKISICIFVMRIPNSKRLNYLLYSLMALVTFANGAAVIVFLAQCRPLEALWDPAVNGNCWNEEIYIGFGEFQGAVSAFTDLICSALPVLVLWKVRISLNVKVAVCTLMGLGLVASACSLVRNILLHTIENPVDITWNVIPIQIWALCEMNLSILAASMPTFLPLYRFLREKVPQTLSHLQTYFVKSSSSSSSSYTATETYPPSRPNTFNANDHYSRLHPTHIRKTVDFEVDVDGNSTKHDKTSLQRDSSETELQKVTMWV